MTEMSDHLAKWVTACVDSAKELASVALGIDQVAVNDIVAAMPSDQPIALIALAGSQSSVQLGISASHEGCQAISKKLLGMELDEPDLESGEVADAMGEAANILAGQVKSLMTSVDSTLNLGIPIFIRGQIDKSADSEVGLANIRIADIPVGVVVIISSEQ
jgi:CheY-specific phosphatase CheX